MDIEEFRQWMAFDRISPIGDERQDVMSAISAFASVKPHVRRGSSVQVSDFMPNWSQAEKKKQAQDRIREHFAALARKTGGREPQ